MPQKSLLKLPETAAVVPLITGNSAATNFTTGIKLYEKDFH